jgi:5-methylcytosine-specific restriction endonuclease McrA
MSLAAHPALVLNADFQPLSYVPLSLWPWRSAVKAILEDAVAVVAEYDAWARSPSTRIRLPSVVALRRYVPVPKRVVFTRFNVFLRDGFRCQYCDGKFAPADLTFDHVLPRARGGQTSWQNVVAACSPCNTRKDKFILKPLHTPREPTPFELLAVQRTRPPSFLHESWMDFLYWDAELEQ